MKLLGKFEEKKLGFRVTGVTHRKIEGKVSGVLRVHLQVNGADGRNLYDKSRDLTTKKKVKSSNVKSVLQRL